MLAMIPPSLYLLFFVISAWFMPAPLPSQPTEMLAIAAFLLPYTILVFAGSTAFAVLMYEVTSYLEIRHEHRTWSPAW